MTRIPDRYHRIDGWRGYKIPGPAVAGCSDTGMCYDSPCPSYVAKGEINRLRREVLRPAGIKSRTRYGSSSNVFCMKRWLVVDAADWPKAKALADEWIEKTKSETRLIHGAD